MTDSSKLLWQTKLHARLHDPAEKALVLLRDPAGHEGGTSRILWRMALADEITAESTLENDNADVLHAVAFEQGIKPTTYKYVKWADWWAAAADRPQWPMKEIKVTTKNGEEKTLSVAPWAQVRWANNPVLIHPLTGQEFDLGKYGSLSDTDFQDIKQRSFEHFSKLLVREENGSTDFKKSVLAFWRFGSKVREEDDYGKLGSLWELLPADTRIPDHSIWDHLDLTSAFAGAFVADPEGQAALLTLSIGPVQPFIAAARKMDDLWAGSHLLARLSWEAMRVVCERLGPDAILFPRLRGIPLVDLWLQESCELPAELFVDCEWKKGSTDANPLFSAALPNRFVAVVPASQAKEIAELVKVEVRDWLQNLGEKVVTELLTIAKYPEEQETLTTPYEQMKEQLNGFPEVHWAAVPFSLIFCGDEKKQRDLDVKQLSDSMKPFFTADAEPGFLGSQAWKVLQKDMQWGDDNITFFAPNPGVLYPAVHELAERVLAAAKSNRSFEPMTQIGWRCSLTGESEWLTTDRAQLARSYRNQDDTLWARISREKPAWAKPGEHLGALSALKRLWPNLFTEEISNYLNDEEKGRQIKRFVVSTHTMAMARQLNDFLEKGNNLDEDLAIKLRKNYQPVALPKKLAKSAAGRTELRNLIARIPDWLDVAKEEAEAGDESELLEVQRTIKKNFGLNQFETYYSLIMMDGDRMGAILAGDEKTTISYLESFHPKMRAGFEEHAESQPIINYGKQGRAISPNRHLAISGALNDFSLTVARHVVEEEHMGRLIYAGGDDVLAMLPVSDLLSAIQRLRFAYSGRDPEHTGGRDEGGLTLQNDFAYLKGRLMRMMGKNATASCGAVIAHHQAPLTAVIRELRLAEQRAKNEGNRNAFSITIIKRSGGALYLTENWGESLKILIKLRNFLVKKGVSRRAVYHTLQWLNDYELPSNAIAEGGLVQSLLTYQLDRQAEGDAKVQVPDLADDLIKMAQNWSQDRWVSNLRNFLSVAEFLAREIRSVSSEGAGS